MATYTYNPDGLRRSKHVVLMLEQRYIWSGDSMVYECELLYPNNGTVYLYGINLISSRNNSGNNTFYLYNAHGDVVQLVDGAGDITQNYNYDAFGVEYDVDEDDDNPFRYCGEYFDKETGTIYLRARYYNPAIGRFTQQDGWEYLKYDDPLSLNLYNYCFNNPISRIDPSGHWPKLSSILAVVAVAVVAAPAMAATVATYAAEEVIEAVDITIFPASDSVSAGDNVISDPITDTGTSTKVDAKEKNNPDPYARPGQKKTGSRKQRK